MRSRTFHRADQVRRLLTYLVEQWEAGRAHDVTEYELGTKALGRQEDFAPETDSSVRTRMHGLRQKLEEYYRDEAPAGGLRLEIPRGAYIPQFQGTGSAAVVEPAAGEVAAAAPSSGPSSSRRRWLWGIGAGAVAVAAGLSRKRWLPGAATPIESLWRPMLVSPQVPAIVVQQPVHVLVRDVRGQVDPMIYPHFPDPLPNSPEFRDYVQSHLGLSAQPKLHASPNATLWGDAAGAAAVARYLAFRNKDSELLPESTLKSSVALKGRPLLLFGRPEFSQSIERILLSLNGYTVRLRNDLRQYAIYNQAKPEEYFTNTRPPNEVTYGLVSVLNDGDARVFVFSGITSDSSAAGVEYLTSEAAVGQLWQRLAGEGHTRWPSAFQVVLRITSSNGYPMGNTYQKHVVLAR